jgi:hypothetical protein
MEVKILCPCGAKYKFDVEPLNEKLPGPVKCPVCQADGTELGNQIVAEKLASAAPPQAVAAAAPAPIRIGIPQTAPAVSSASGSGFVSPSIPRSSKDLQPSPAPVSVVGASVVPAVPVAAPVVAKPAGGTRLSVSTAHAVAAPANEATPPVPRAAAHAQVKKIEGDMSFARGLVGIAAASFLGLLMWFAISLFLGAKFKWIAIGIGWMIGWAGYKLAKEKSQRLGLAAAAATALVMIGGVLWSARQEAYQAVNETINELWMEEVAFAKKAVAASRSDERLRAFLAEEEFGSDEDPGDEDGPIMRVRAAESDAIDAKALADFKKDQLPGYRKLAEGKVSKSQYEREHRPMLEQVFTIGFIFERALKVKFLIIVGLAVAAAWKLSSGA